MKKVAEHDHIGNLELYLLKILWDAGGWLDVKDVVARMDGSRAYTTIMTTLVRLHKKGLIDQKKLGRGFVYRPKVTQKTVIKGVLARMAALLFDGDLKQLMPQILNIEKELTKTERAKLRVIASKIKDRGTS